MSRRLLVAIILVSVAAALLVVANIGRTTKHRERPPEADDQSGRSLRDRQVVR